MTVERDTGALDLAVSDFGPIVEANIDLRPLTVFVGPSNTGKSYLAILLYAAHCFFSGVGGRRRPGAFIYRLGMGPRSTDPLSADSMDALADWATKLAPSIRDEDDRAPSGILPEPVAKLIRDRFTPPQEPGNSGDRLDAEIMRCFGVDAIEGLIRRPGKGKARVRLRRHTPDGPPFEHAFTVPARGRPPRISVPEETPLRFADVPAWIVQEAAMGRDAGADERRQAMAALVHSLLGSVVRHALGPVARPVHYLPADRTGIMHAHRVVVSALVGRASRAGFRQDRPLPVLSGVLSDFLEQLIEPKGRGRQSTGLRALAARLEENVLDGAIRTRVSETGYPSFLYRPADWKTDLPLMNTSSMVSELAPVVLYLREVVRPGETLIIEEPESHLHPAMQVEFTRVLAAAAKAGIRIVVTTHSEWVLEALANLVRLSALPRKQREGIAGADAALGPGEVGAWRFLPKKRPRGTVVEEIPLDLGAGTFPAGYGDITERLYNDWARISNLAQGAANHDDAAGTHR